MFSNRFDGPHGGPQYNTRYESWGPARRGHGHGRVMPLLAAAFLAGAALRRGSFEHGADDSGRHGRGPGGFGRHGRGPWGQGEGPTPETPEQGRQHGGPWGRGEHGGPWGPVITEAMGMAVRPRPRASCSPRSARSWRSCAMPGVAGCPAPARWSKSARSSPTRASASPRSWPRLSLPRRSPWFKFGSPRSLRRDRTGAVNPQTVPLIMFVACIMYATSYG